jgi:hypothetical protein
VAAAEEKQRQQVAERERVRLAQERERTLRPLLVKTADPQSVYLQAGRFERSSDFDAARQLYEHLVDNFTKTPWAVKANDRLLSLRAQENSRQRVPEGGEARASTPVDRTRMQAAGQDDAMRARARMQQDMFDEMDRINEENRRRMEEDRRRLEEQQRAENEARERANEIRRRQQEEWEAEERRRRGG